VHTEADKKQQGGTFDSAFFALKAGGFFANFALRRLKIQARWLNIKAILKMKLPEKLNRLFRTPRLTRVRIVIALAIAVVADGLQFILGPLGWVFGDQAIDCVTMILVSWIIGFHILLLPTFVVELVPVLEELPTWTACTIAVIALRKRQQRTSRPPDKPIIEI
jgi:hypothetical protein